MTTATAPRQLQGSPIPRLATPIPPGAVSIGEDMVQLAEALGEPLFPWQINVSERAALVNPSTGRWQHQTVAVVVARQNGKTHLLRLRILAGLFLWGEALIVHTAQNREIALETFRAVVDTIERTPWLRSEVRHVRQTNGQEQLTLKNGNRYRIVASTAAAARGLSADLVLVDEAREHRTNDAYAALVYTTQARPNPQVWLTSNAGDATSVVLNRVRDQAVRAIAAPGTDDTVGYLEWSAPPGCKLDDREAWCAANPSLGLTLTEETLEARVRSDPPDVVRTELLCQWVDTLESPWPADAWTDAHQAGLELVPGRPTWLALDIAPNRRTGALVAVQKLTDADGDMLLLPGTAPDRYAAFLVDTWSADGALDELAMAGDVAEVARQLEACVIAYDRYTAAAVAARLASAGFATEDTSGARFAQACDELLSAMVTRRVVHGGQAALTDHVLACAKKPASDGGWRIIRRKSAGPVAGAIALAMALHHALRPQSEASIMVG